MELTVKERLQLASVLPPTGNITTLRIVRQLKEKLSFSEEEHKEFQIRDAGEPLDWMKPDAEGNKPVCPQGSIAWNEEKERPVDIPIGEKAMDVIVEALKAANERGQLTLDMIDLYDKFVPEGGAK
jgi:hypothetical protein